MSGETSNSNEQANPESKAWESLQRYNTNDHNEFAGETNLNSATGEPRTFTQFDKFPRLEGETPEQYGARLKRINELNAQAQDELYQKSDRGEQERAAEAEYDRITAKLEQAVKDGRMSEEHARNLAEKQLEIFDKKTDELRQKFQEDQALQDWVDSSDVYKRADVIAEVEAKQTTNNEAKRASQQENEKVAVSEAEKTLTDEQEKIATIENEKTGTYLEDVENPTPDEAEARIAEHKELQLAAPEAKKNGTYLEDAENPAPNEAKARQAEHQAILSQLDLSNIEQNEASDPKQIEALKDELSDLRLELAERELSNLRLELAELFVKKNRIFGPKHREEYDQVRTEYEEALEQYLNLKSKTDEELFQNYLEEDNKLLEDVDNQVDNGNLFRKIISRTLGNEYYKQAMHAHGARSLGVAGAESIKPNSEQPEVIEAPTLAQAEANAASASEPTSVLDSEQTSESTPEPQPSPESTSEPASEPTPDSVPNQDAPDPEQERDDKEREFRDFVDSNLGGLIGSDGVDIVSMRRKSGEAADADTSRIAAWWGSLTPSQQAQVKNFATSVARDYANQHDDQGLGGAFFYWLEQQGESGN